MKVSLETRQAEREAAQSSQRCQEQSLRQRCVELLIQFGLSARSLARRVGLKARSLCHWQKLAELGKLLPRALGRPSLGLDRDLEARLLEFFAEHGSVFGLPSLKALFPEVSATLLRELLRLQRLFEKQSESPPHSLIWTRVGAAWSMDFSQMKPPIDGCYPYLLLVRDLASRMILRAAPLMSCDTASTQAVLSSLITTLGAPLVLKSDNGSAFISHDFEPWLNEQGVSLMRSPVRQPRYNGGIERSIGAFKERLVDISSRAGRPCHWSSEDLVEAQSRANDLTRPWGPKQGSPSMLWRDRERIGDGERQGFQEVLARMRGTVLQEAATLEECVRDVVALEREAIKRSLLELDYLQFRRGRITPRLPR